MEQAGRALAQSTASLWIPFSRAAFAAGEPGGASLFGDDGARKSITINARRREADDGDVWLGAW